MRICEFFGWAEQASAGERAEAAGALAKAYLYADLDPIDFGDAERALTTLLDDPSPLVRHALAEALASAIDAPHHILLALAADRADIAAMVLERSPVLSDADLIDTVAIGDDLRQSAVARRASVSAALAGALAEVGGPDAVLALCRNGGATLSDVSARRVIERFSHDGRIREALNTRGGLAPETRHALVEATAAALSDFARHCGWMAPERARRVAAEARERATMTIGAELPRDDSSVGMSNFVAYLHGGGHVTPALMMRALLSGDVAMFEAVMAECSGKSPARIAGLARNPQGLGFAAVYKSAGLPLSLLPAVRAALRAIEAIEAQPQDGRLDRRVIARVLQGGTLNGASQEDRQLIALLHRLDAEAAREEARGESVARRTSLPAPQRPASPPPRAPAILLSEAA